MDAAAARQTQPPYAACRTARTRTRCAAGGAAGVSLSCCCQRARACRPVRFSRRTAWAPTLHAHRAWSCVPRGPLQAVHRYPPGQGEADRRQHPHGRRGQVRTRTGADLGVSPIRHALCWAPVAPTRSGGTCLCVPTAAALCRSAQPSLPLMRPHNLFGSTI